MKFSKTLLLTLSLFIVKISATSDPCLYWIDNIKNTLFSLQTAVSNDGLYDIFFALKELSSVVASTCETCGDRVYFGLKSLNNFGSIDDCSESLDYVGITIDEFFENEEDFQSIQNLISFIPKFEKNCEIIGDLFEQKERINGISEDFGGKVEQGFNNLMPKEEIIDLKDSNEDFNELLRKQWINGHILVL